MIRTFFLVCIFLFEIEQLKPLSTRISLEGKISLLVPSCFKLMDAKRLALKYPSPTHRPSEVYTNEHGTINVALNYTTTKAEPTQLSDVKKTMELQFGQAPFIFEKSEIKSLNGSQFVIIEFVSQAVDSKIFNLMAIGSLEGRLMIATFNCTEGNRKEWESIGRKIIDSITIRR